MAAAYYQKKLGQYDYYETISALRKDIKLGKIEDAFYWLNILLTYGEHGAKTAAKQLWVMAAEDIDDDSVVMRAFAVYQMTGKVTETDHLFFLVAKMAQARKWWEHPDGVMVDYLWAKAEGDLKNHPKSIPSYALDEHTAKGARAKKLGNAIDNRFSGHNYGRQQTAFLFERDGRLDPDLYPDQEFYTRWEQYRELAGEADEPKQQALLDGVLND
jgi:replication-associated recombination protein RarA